MTSGGLEVTALHASYGSSRVLFGVDLAVAPGEAVALTGRNGVGKSTTVRAICGLLPASAGRIAFDGRPLAGLPAHRVAGLGIGLVPEGRRCFADLDVRENLVVAARPGPWDLAAVTALFPRLGERLGQRCGTLSGGEQQMVAIGRALMTNPALLILDEATEGLAPLVRREIWQALGELRRRSGLSLLIIDKSLRELAGVADRAVVLDRGETVWAGPVGALTPALAERHLGLGRATPG